jgi:acyl-coenzyme A thioesterase PaaI-like protein
MTMLDAAGMWACSEAGQPPGCPTVSINCNFIRAVKPSQVSSLRARAELVRKGRRMYFVNITALADDDVVATAQGVYAVLHPAGQ